MDVHAARTARTLSAARACALPRSTLLAGALPRIDYADAYAVPVRRGLPDDPTVWARAVFRDPPTWVSTLSALREALVRPLGIERVGRWTGRPLAVADDEVLLGADAGHLDFRASVRREPGRVVVSTIVQLHDLRGRLYFAGVRLVHPAIVRAMLARAATRLARGCHDGGPAGRRRPR